MKYRVERYQTKERAREIPLSHAGIKPFCLGEPFHENLDKPSEMGWLGASWRTRCVDESGTVLWGYKILSLPKHTCPSRLIFCNTGHKQCSTSFSLVQPQKWGRDECRVQRQAEKGIRFLPQRHG